MKEVKDIQEQHLEWIEAYKKQLMSNKKERLDFLISVGVLTAKGNLKKSFKDLCTPPDLV